jgi:hypothetical protein
MESSDEPAKAETIDQRLERKRLEGLLASAQARPTRPGGVSMDEKLQILIKHLPALREQGVSCLKIDGIELLLRPVLPSEEIPQKLEPPQGRDPLRYGLKPGTEMPTLRGRNA